MLLAGQPGQNKLGWTASLEVSSKPRGKRERWLILPRRQWPFCFKEVLKQQRTLCGVVKDCLSTRTGTYSMILFLFPWANSLTSPWPDDERKIILQLLAKQKISPVQGKCTHLGHLSHIWPKMGLYNTHTTLCFDLSMIKLKQAKPGKQSDDNRANHLRCPKATKGSPNFSGT